MSNPDAGSAESSPRRTRPPRPRLSTSPDPALFLARVGRELVEAALDPKGRTDAAIRRGTAAGCPFCAALAAPALQVGDAVHILSGLFCGTRARVSGIGPIAGEVRLHLDGEPPECEVRFQPERDLALRPPSLERPAWFPPLSLRDAGLLHQETLEFLARECAQPDPLPYPTDFYWLVRAIWQARLPIETRELEALLTQHGFPEERARAYATIYDHGVRLLVVAAGRKPIKRKRLKQADWLPTAAVRSEAT